MESGDVCSIVCPGEAHRVAAELGVDMADVGLAAAFHETELGILIVTMRFDGAATKRLVLYRPYETFDSEEFRDSAP